MKMVAVACDVFLKIQIRSRDFGKLIISIVPLAPDRYTYIL